MGPRNRFQGLNSASLCSLAGRYNNPIPTRCQAPTDFLKFQLRIHATGLHNYYSQVWEEAVANLFDPDDVCGHAGTGSLRPVCRLTHRAAGSQAQLKIFFWFFRSKTTF